MTFKDQISNQNVGFFMFNRECLFFGGIIGSPQAFNRYQIIPGCMQICQPKNNPKHRCLPDMYYLCVLYFSGTIV